MEIGVLSARLERFRDLSYDAPRGREAVAKKFRVLSWEIQKLRELLEEKSFTDRIKKRGKSIDRINIKFMKLVYDIENAMEFHLLQDVTVSLLMRRLSPKDDDFLSFRDRIADLKHQFDVSRGLRRPEENVEDDEGPTSSSIEPSNHLEIDSIKYDEEAILEGDKSNLVYMLLNGGSDGNGTSRIAITGPDGVPTTTLAKWVFNDPDIQSKFEGFAWVWVGQKFRERHVLENILYRLGIPQNELSKMKNVPDLKQVLLDKLKQKKCLIVLDDIWSDAWCFINGQLPDEHRGCVIITTQFYQITDDFRGKVYLSRMTTMESFQLFKLHSEIKLDDSDTNDDNLQRKETVNNILSHCQNFPMAIVEVAKLLKKETKLERWNDMGEFKQEVGTIPDSRILNAVRSRYDLLPSYLKSFFLYLGQFPPGHLIPVEKLYLMMMADGLIPKDRNIEGIEVTESCLTELADRSLVIKVGNDPFSPTREHKACRVHNLIHYLCINLGKEEEFFEVGPIYDTYNTIRVVVYLNEMDSYSYIPRKDSIRSLIFYGKNESLKKIKWAEEVLDLKDFPWIRILDFNGVDFRADKQKLPKNIDQLLYLRYLGFQDCYLPNLEFSLTNFTNLETLDLRVRSSCKMIIPNVLYKLLNLIYLYFPVSYQSGDREKLKLEGMSKLQVIENFHAGVCNVGHLRNMKLQRFSGIADGNTKCTDIEAITKVMNTNRDLRAPSFTLVKFDCYSIVKQNALKTVFKCEALESLHLEGELIKMPQPLKISQNFINMVFDGSEFEEDPMEILGTLPKLRSLVLCNDAIVGKEIVFSDSSFKQLRYLKLGNLQELEKLVLDSEALPNLSILTIEQCHKLKSLPVELMRKESSITELKIGSNPSLFKDVSRQKDEKRLNMTITPYDC